MYGLSADVIRPGCTVNDVVQYRIGTGTLTSTEAEGYVQDRKATLTNSTTVSKTFSSPNGRVIVVTRRPMGGGGWVATHEDITERHQAEARIAHMAHHDALTGLPNRTMLRERIESALLQIPQGKGLAVLWLTTVDNQAPETLHSTDLIGGKKRPPPLPLG